MRENGIYAKREKCYFMQKRIPFLGHYVSQKGIETDPKKISTIKEWPEIKTKKQLMSFLGLTGYYRKFIKDYAKKALPLTRLLKGDGSFEWTQDQEDAKQLMIEALTTAPVLKKPNFREPMTLTTDASDVTLGAELSQDGHPIAFLSKTFSNAELNWPIYEKELFAVIYSLYKWESWLLGIELTIVTDNSAVQCIQKQPKLVPKQAH